jgi:hypothetical protein
MNKELFFNDTSLCIFTDASSKQISMNPYTITTAPAVIFYINNMEVFRGYEIVQNCKSSYEGEQRAFSLAMAWLPSVLYRYPYISYVRIFTDNISTLKTYRDYIPESSYHDNQMKFGNIMKGDFNKSCKDVINLTSWYIYNNNISLELYHTFGHIGSKHSMKEVADRFPINNWQCQGNTPDEDLINTLKVCNNAVDKFSTEVLKRHYNENYIIPVTFQFDWSNKKVMNKYNTLVGGRYYGIGLPNQSTKEHIQNRLHS